MLRLQKPALSLWHFRSLLYSKRDRPWRAAGGFCCRYDLAVRLSCIYIYLAPYYSVYVHCTNKASWSRGWIEAGPMNSMNVCSFFRGRHAEWRRRKKEKMRIERNVGSCTNHAFTVIHYKNWTPVAGPKLLLTYKVRRLLHIQRMDVDSYCLRNFPLQSQARKEMKERKKVKVNFFHAFSLLPWRWYASELIGLRFAYFDSFLAKRAPTVCFFVSWVNEIWEKKVFQSFPCFVYTQEPHYCRSVWQKCIIRGDFQRSGALKIHCLSESMMGEIQVRMFVTV